jgi:hypothetical protein
MTEAEALRDLTISRWSPPHLVHRIVQYSDPAFPAMTDRIASLASQSGQSDRTCAGGNLVGCDSD